MAQKISNKFCIENIDIKLKNLLPPYFEFTGTGHEFSVISNEFIGTSLEIAGTPFEIVGTKNITNCLFLTVCVILIQRFNTTLYNVSIKRLEK